MGFRKGEGVHVSQELIIALITFVFSGAVQKLTGMGFALVATPVLVLLYGPVDGVLMILLLGVLISAVMLIGHLSQVDWKRTLTLCAGGVLVAPLGLWLVRTLPEAGLFVCVGLAALIALASPYLSMRKPGREPRAGNSPFGTVLMGGVSGLLNFTSGLSGPPLVAYAQRQRWGHLEFVASVQVVFIVFDAVTIALRGFPNTPLPEMGAMTVAVLVGFLAGTAVTRFIPTKWARVGMFTIAWAGALTVLIRGVAGFLS